MAAPEQIKYRKLPGSGYYPTVPRWSVVALFFLLGILVLLLYRRRQLYLGPDHLLTVDSNGYAEEYRFFKFSDIQSLTLRSNSSYVTWIVAFTIMCALMIIIAASVEDWVVIGVFGSLAALSGIALLTHVMKGSTVTCEMTTAVSRIELPSLGRLGTARSSIAEIRAEIEKAQGRLEAEDIARELGVIENQTFTRPDPRPVFAPEPPPTPTAATPPAPPDPTGVEADEKDSQRTF